MKYIDISKTTVTDPVFIRFLRDSAEILGEHIREILTSQFSKYVP